MSKDLTGALTKSLQDESAAIEDRFARADGVFKAQPARRAAAPKKIRVIRDQFTFPELDHALIAKIDGRCLGAGHKTNKSEIVRAGLKALARMPDGDLLEAVRRVEKLSAGKKGTV